MEKAILTNYGTGKAFSTPIVLSNEKYSLGRGLQNDCVFNDVSISRNHCTIEKSGKEWIVIDRSSNGTLINGNLLGRLKAHVLQDGDVIAMGNNIQFQFVKRSNTPEPVTESNKSSLSEEEIMNIADAIIAEVEGPKIQLSQSVENEFNIPMDIEGNNSTNDANNSSSVESSNINSNVDGSLKSQPPHSVNTTLNMTPSSDVPKTTVISINPSNCFITKGSLLINSNIKPNKFTLSTLSQPIFVQNTLAGVTATTSTNSTALPSWLIGMVSHKINQQSQNKSKSSITKTSPKGTKLKSSVSSPPKTYSNTKKGSKKKITTEASTSKGSPEVKEEPKSVVEEAKEEKIAKEESEPKPGCSKASETKLHTVEDELQCSICTEMFIKAVTLSCSHTFCKFCIDEWKRKKTACPICRAPIRSILPTLVIDSFIEKILENADEETKLQRSKLIADRESLQPSGSKDYKSKEKSSTDGETINHDAIILSSDSDTNSYDSELDSGSYYDYDDDSDYGYVPYNGLPGAYYGGYGFCYRCGERGHWVRGCPNK